MVQLKRGMGDAKEGKIYKKENSRWNIDRVKETWGREKWTLFSVLVLKTRYHFVRLWYKILIKTPVT
jgi:hypothetical protein